MRSIQLFTPLQLGPVTVNNRIAIPPMCMYRAKSGMAQIFHKVHYGSLVCSGAGLLTIEAVAFRMLTWDFGLMSAKLRLLVRSKCCVKLPQM